MNRTRHDMKLREIELTQQSLIEEEATTMTTAKLEMRIRPMTLADLDAIFLVDRKIRAIGEAITYANLTTERMFTIDRHVGRLAKPISHIDLITGDVSGLLEFGLVAEAESHVRGFILGRVAHVGETAARVGLILILGVHPDYQRKGIATRLVNAICDKFSGSGIRTVRIGIDQRDKGLLGFFEYIGFNAGHLVDYTKTL